MITKLKNVKPNNDDTITLYLDKGVDLMFLMGLRGHKIDIQNGDGFTEQDFYTQALDDKKIMAVNAILDAYELGKQEEQAKWQQPGPEDKSISHGVAPQWSYTEQITKKGE